MPVGRLDGCLSTTWCHATCVTVKTRPEQRNTDAGSISRTAHTRDQKALCVTVFTTRRRCAMPVGRSDGCLSTAWCHATCVMVKTRPEQRNTDAGSISGTAHTRDQKALRVTVFTTRRRCAMPVGRSDGCLSSAWCHATCVMVKTRPEQRITDAGSISRTAHTRIRSASRNGFHHTEAVCDARWSIRRLSEHRMVSCDVCDGQDPSRAT